MELLRRQHLPSHSSLCSTVQAAWWVKGWYRERDAKPSHPAYRAELPTPELRWWVCLLWTLQKTTKLHQRKGNNFGKETGFAVRCSMTGHPWAFMEMKFFQAPKEGRVTSTALQSQRIAKTQDCLGTSMNNCTGFWSPCTSLVLLPGLGVSLGRWTHYTHFSEPLKGFTVRSSFCLT